MRKLLCGFLAATLVAAAAPVLSLTPSAIVGLPGNDIGWGFTIANDVGWVVVTEVGFCQGTGNTAASLGAGPCTTGYASVGSFADPGVEYLTNHPAANPGDLWFVIAPNTSLVESFGPGTGIGPFTINPAAAVGSSVSGQILVLYDLWSADPNLNPSASVIGGNLMTAEASVNVIPEPAMLALTGLSLMLMSALPLIRRRRN